MPLMQDGLDRGAHSYHVYAHAKLGKHQTVIRAAWVLVNQLIDRKDVVEVDLGRIFVAKNRAWSPERVNCQQKGRRLEIMFIAKDAAQQLSVTFRVGTDLQNLSGQIERFAEDVM